jgi:hypothetical protein
MAGTTQTGPVPSQLTVKDQCTNLSDFTKKYNPSGRNDVGSQQMYDAVDSYFSEGGSKLYVVRVTGAGDATAEIDIPDASAEVVFTAKAKYPGVFSNNIAVVIVDNAMDSTVPIGNYYIAIQDSLNASGVNQERSQLFTAGDKLSALAWGQNSKYITLEDGPSDLIPVGSNYILVGGSSATPNDDDLEAALSDTSTDLGPGQVCAPGKTTDPSHLILANHALAFNRVAILDAPDTADVTTLIGAADAVFDNSNKRSRFSGLFAPWVVVPGEVTGTTKRVPPSPIVCGVMSYNDGHGLNPNEPSAGPNGVVRTAVGASQSWDDDDRRELNQSGVNVIKTQYGLTKIYGYRTLADPYNDKNWLPLGNVRLHRLIVALSAEVGEWFVFRMIDGKGVLIGDFGATLSTHVMLPLFNDRALFGDTPDQAYRVDVSGSVNTPETLANNELHAVITCRMSPFGEDVYIEIVKLLVTEEIPA